jgi:hypothetical protein
MLANGRFSPDHDEPLCANQGRDVLRVFERGTVHVGKPANLVQSFLDCP